jgi:hypothetical protein
MALSAYSGWVMPRMRCRQPHNRRESWLTWAATITVSKSHRCNALPQKKARELTSEAQFRRQARLLPARVAPAATFQQWVGSRLLRAPSTNAGAAVLPFQTWHRFKEAFSPELVAMAVKASQRTVRRVLDPCGGSGTTALAAQFMGIDSVSIEVNPFLADVIKAKVCSYEVHELIKALPRVARLAQRSKPTGSLLTFLPPTFVEPGRNGRWLFDSRVVEELSKLQGAINGEPAPAVRRLLTVLLGGLLTEFSNATVSGKGRRYRKNWESRRVDPRTVLPRFCDSVANAIVEIDALGNRPKSRAQVLRGDSRIRIGEAGQVDLVVCSPPYPNSFDYTDVYNIELWMLGYLKSFAHNTELRRSTFTSHVQVDRKYGQPPRTPMLDRTMQRLERARHSLWDSHLVDMVGGYFADLTVLLQGVVAALKPTGQAWFVVGDSQYAQVRVRVADVLSELAPMNGLTVVRREPFRSMRLSPQQGGSRRLAETLVVLAKE